MVCRNAECQNTVGSFRCMCGTGLTLDTSGMNCIGKHHVIVPWSYCANFCFSAISKGIIEISPNYLGKYVYIWLSFHVLMSKFETFVPVKLNRILNISLVVVQNLLVCKGKMLPALKYVCAGIIHNLRNFILRVKFWGIYFFIIFLLFLLYIITLFELKCFSKCFTIKSCCKLLTNKFLF